MSPFLYLLLFTFSQDTVPFKPSEEFELTMNYDFRQRVIHTDEVDIRNPVTSSGPLPYLELTLKVLEAREDETRVRITTNLNEILLNRKLTVGEPYTFDAGYTVDMKDRVEAHEFTIVFSSGGREKVSKIVIHVTQDGAFMVNNEVRGRL